MNATFRQLRLFLALAEEGSMTRAAQRCHITQPTASMQLRELSLSIGVPLYEVIGKKIHLTDIGHELARTARAMMDEWNTFSQTADRLKGLSRGELRVAVVSTAKYFIPRMLGGFCQTYPDIDIKLDVFNRDGVIGLLRDNAVDLAVMSVPPADLDVDAERFLDNPLVAIAPAGHRLTGEPSIPLAALASEPLIMREQGSGTRMTAEKFFRENGLAPRIRLSLGSNEAIREAVAGGLGCAILSRHAIGGASPDALFTILPVDGFPIRSQWFTVVRRGKKLGPIATVFRTYLRETSLALSNEPIA
jgi:DNA-binding transcriptional LysR family regulator